MEARGQAEEREALSHLSNDAMSAVWGGEMAKTEALVAALREVAEARGEAAREAAKGMVAMRGEVGRVEALLATAEEQRVQQEREGRKERERLEGLIFQARATPLVWLLPVTHAHLASPRPPCSFQLREVSAQRGREAAQASSYVLAACTQVRSRVIAMSCEMSRWE